LHLFFKTLLPNWNSTYTEDRHTDNKTSLRLCHFVVDGNSLATKCQREFHCNISWNHTLSCIHVMPKTLISVYHIMCTNN